MAITYYILERLNGDTETFMEKADVRKEFWKSVKGTKVFVTYDATQIDFISANKPDSAELLAVKS